ncbi:SRPBCC family protein [Brevibacterium atlanticum]|uniref:SRPBCC family protein n=1 Tax=Brevibacterium atlanticum TaxID=2697563 RepID=UPI001421034A|nr:SRPBCC domain-containing protein [Brevibacterium atlanticum]
MTDDGKVWGIEKTVQINAPVTEVWPHIRDARLLSRWWCPPPTVRITFDPCLGAAYSERYDDGTHSYAIDGDILEVDPPRGLTIRRTTNGRFGDSDQVSINLGDRDSQTLVRLHHSFPDIPARRRGEAYDFYVDGWDFSLNLLSAEVARSLRSE